MTLDLPEQCWLLSRRTNSVCIGMRMFQITIIFHANGYPSAVVVLRFVSSLEMFLCIDDFSSTLENFLNSWALEYIPPDTVSVNED